MLDWKTLLIAIVIFGFPGAYSKDCPGTRDYLNSHNIDRFSECTHIRGNLIINENSLSNFSAPSQFNEKLYNLINVTEIDGYLVIEKLNHSYLTNLRFLRNLERIHGMETIRLFNVQDYTLIIQNNPHLLTLNLASLKSIENGGLRILDNPQLCLVDSISIEDYLVNSTLSRTGGLGYICSVICHGECVEEHGCWGTLPDECVMCRGYTFMRTCVETCNLSISVPDPGRSLCMPITSQPHPPSSTTDIPHTTTLDNFRQHTSTIFEGTLSSTPFTIQAETEIKILIPAGVVGALLALIALMAIAGLLMYYSMKRKKSKKLPLSKQNRSTSLCRTPEKYSQPETDRTILVSPCDDNSSTNLTTRSPNNVSISSLATASIHSSDQKNDFHDLDTPGITQPATSLNRNAIPLSATSAITRRNSPTEHAHNSESSASYYTPSNADTGYSSSANSRKPSVIGSRASSTSLRRPSLVGNGTGGNVYSTGQHQIHPNRHLHQHQYLQNHRSKGSLVSQMNASTSSAVDKPTNGDKIHISTLANNSEYFEPPSSS